jgi:hypothetical protein
MFSYHTRLPTPNIEKNTSHPFSAKKYMPNFRDGAISLKHLGAQSPDGECSVDGLGYALRW